MTQPTTLGELRKIGWVSRPVKEEMRANAAKAVAASEPLFEGVLGYENTVLPQLENAMLAGHDVVFLGERGQAKTRMIRSLVNLLDEWMPYIEGSEIFDDPYNPVSRHALDLIAEHGDDTPIAWAHRGRPLWARSWPRRTRRLPTSSARWTRSRWPKAATCPTS